jgi:hypothetical protein
MSLGNFSRWCGRGLTEVTSCTKCNTMIKFRVIRFIRSQWIMQISKLIVGTILNILDIFIISYI